MSFNKIIIVGNLGQDPDLRYTPQGVAVCNFTLATNEKKTDKSGEKQDVTTWFKVTLWRYQAENAAKYLTKGTPVYIEGRLSIEEWTDRENNKRYTLAVNASDMQFISSGNRDAAGDSGYEPRRSSAGNMDSDYAPAYSGPPAETSNPGSAPLPDDDIPF